MKNIIIVLINFLAITISSSYAETVTNVTQDKNAKPIVTTQLEASPIQQLELRLLDSMLESYHYNQSKFDSSKSAEVLNQYLELLDYGKYLFTEDDIKSFDKYKNNLGDYAKKGDLTVVYDMYNQYVAKMKTRLDWINARLQKPFDKNSKDSIIIDRDNIPWAKNQQELDQRWNKRLLNEWIYLVLAKKTDKEASEILQKRYSNISKRIDKTEAEDVFQLYANAITEVYDPHTSYFSPKTNETFNINMSLSLEGIGASLSIEDEVIVIRELIAGGPAIKSGSLEVGDKILGVGQGKDGKIEDVVGWKLDDAVELIRGKRGTIVRLQIQKKRSNEIEEITLVRDKIKLEEQAAKSEIKEIDKNGTKFKLGIITLPSFYIDFAAASKNQKNYRSTTRDVKKLILDLEKQKIDGLLIDLRNDGGGSLFEAVNLTGLFIDNGPVVQVKSSDGEIKVNSDNDPTVTYAGPLAILINGYSASASEIFTAALKDYDRALILGEPSFGKGTVQNIVNFNEYLPSIKDPVGSLKMTIAMFYRINGSSTQIKGVLPDIYIPKVQDNLKTGESKEKHALAWRSIKALPYDKKGKVSEYVPYLQAEYNKYYKDNKALNIYVDYTNWAEQVSKEKTIPLNLAARESKKELLKKKELDFSNELREIYGYKAYDATYFDKKDIDKTKKEKDAEKAEKTDIVRDASVDVLATLAQKIASEAKK